MKSEMEEHLLESEKKKEEILPKEEKHPLLRKEKFIGERINNKIHGVLEQYDQEGNLISSQNFDEGRLQGESQRYDLLQRPKEKITYHKGLPHGPAEFYKQGRPYLQMTFQEGKPHGEMVLYNEGGLIQSRIQFEHGVKEGNAFFYDRFGVLRRVLCYQQDLLDGPVFIYYPNGALLESGAYVQGRRHGEFKFFDENGDVKRIRVFDQGRLIHQSTS